MEADGEIWCTVPGHKESGMTPAIKVTGAHATEEVAEEPRQPRQRPRPTATSRPSTRRPSRRPDWTPFDPTLAPAPGGTEHEVTLRATETELEVAPGVTQMMWTFEDQVPGPILRGKVGDLFTVTLVNEGEVGHSIDFHASKVAWDDEMRTIASGEELVYQFRPTTPARSCTTAAPRRRCTTSATACTARSSSTRPSWHRSPRSS